MARFLSQLTVCLALVLFGSCRVLGAIDVTCAEDVYGHALGQYEVIAGIGEVYGFSVIGSLGMQCEGTSTSKGYQSLNDCAEKCYDDPMCTHFAVWKPEASQTCQHFTSCTNLVNWNTDKSGVYALYPRACKDSMEYIAIGIGDCLDAVGAQYVGWNGNGSFADCQQYCDASPTCVGFEVDTNYADGWRCAVRYDHGTRPMGSPGSGAQGIIGDATANGAGEPKNTSGTYPTSRTCYAKKDYGGPVATTTRALAIEVATLAPTGAATTVELAATSLATLQVEVVGFSVTMNVTNAVEFAQDPEVKNVLREAMAELVGVNTSWIQDLRLVQLRRLDSWGRELQSSFHTTTADGSVRIEFDVVIPPEGGPNHITATILLSEFEEKSFTEANEIINRIVNSGALGSNYELAIRIKEGTIKQQQHIARSPTPSSNAEGLPITIIAIAVTGGIVLLLLIYLLTIVRARKISVRRTKLEHSHLLRIDGDEDFTEAKLLFPPQAVSADCIRRLSYFISGMLDYSRPIVLVCFAGCPRVEYDKLSGPGIFYAGAVIQALHRHGIACYTSLPDATPTDACFEYLSNENCHCKLFLLIDTPEVYQCRRLLEQIYTAQACNVDITRLQFESDLPPEEDQWRNIRDDDEEGLQKRELVRKLLPSRLIVPDSSETVRSVPDCLETFAMDLSRKFKSLDTFKAALNVADIAATAELDRLHGREDSPSRSSAVSKKEKTSLFKSFTRLMEKTSLTRKKSEGAEQISPSPSGTSSVGLSSKRKKGNSKLNKAATEEVTSQRRKREKPSSLRRVPSDGAHVFGKAGSEEVTSQRRKREKPSSLRRILSDGVGTASTSATGRQNHRSGRGRDKSKLPPKEYPSF